MTVYVESNFLLEIALQQEQSASAEDLLARAEAGHLMLRWPGFCLAECLGALMRRGSDRRQVQAAVHRQAGDLARSGAHASFAETLRRVSQELVDIEALESSRFDGVVRKLLGIGPPISLDAETYANAAAYRSKHDLEPKDAVVYACVISDLGRARDRTPSLFVSKDAKAFEASDLEADLARLGCTYVRSFDSALKAV